MCALTVSNLLIASIVLTSRIMVLHAVTEIRCDSISNYLQGRQYCIIKGLTGDENTTFEYVPSFFATFKTELVFDKCTLSSIPKGIFRAFPHLKTMYTWNSGIKIVSKVDFLDADDLRVIDMSKNRIEMISHSTFFWAIDLEFIDLSENKIVVVERNAFHGLIHLRTLHLQMNLIEEIEPRTFDILPSIETLHLNDNALQSIDKHLFSQNSKLKSILLHNNRIKTISGTTCQHLRQLMHFDMHNNPTEGLDLFVVDADYTNIRNINCKGCYIGPKTKKLFASHNNISYVIQNGTGLLVELDISNNNLYSIKNLTELENLKELDLSHNHIQDIDITTFANMTELETLKLKQSGFSRINYGSFSHKLKLKILDISFNGLRTIDLNMFAALTDLENLYLEGNNLTEINLSEVKQYFPLLTKIGISKNNWKCASLAEVIKILGSNKIELNSNGTATKTSNIRGIPCTKESQDTVAEYVLAGSAKNNLEISLINPDDTSPLAKLTELKYELVDASEKLAQISNKLNAVLEFLNSDL
ncbi:leucine-rich repeat-containing protein 40-like [Bradysia coprophila]|uniref:leucine-rich repeat-containing protein 40-like n=1 Tax=Bradysia coprophila TaxID=38358 RepID=UPI00187D7F9A|nr:leucine-rich repeat-containing protein 40-like [Bradysia coprophila]